MLALGRRYLCTGTDRVSVRDHFEEHVNVEPLHIHLLFCVYDRQRNLAQALTSRKVVVEANRPRPLKWRFPWYRRDGWSRMYGTERPTIFSAEWPPRRMAAESAFVPAPRPPGVGIDWRQRNGAAGRHDQETLSVPRLRLLCVGSRAITVKAGRVKPVSDFQSTPCPGPRPQSACVPAPMPYNPSGRWSRRGELQRGGTNCLISLSDD